MFSSKLCLAGINRSKIILVFENTFISRLVDLRDAEVDPTPSARPRRLHDLSCMHE